MEKMLFVVVCISYIAGQFGRVYFPNGVAVTLLDISVFCVVTYWMLKTKFAVVKKPFFLDKPLVLLFICMLVSLGINTFVLTLNQTTVAFLYILRFILYALFIKVIIHQRQKNAIINALFVIGTGIVAVGYAQYFFYPYLGNLSYLEWDDHLYRMFSTFLDPNFAGAFFCLFLFFLFPFVASSWKQRSHKKLIFFSVLGVATFVAIFLTYSRSAFFMLVAGTSVYFFLKGYKYLIVAFIIVAFLTLLLLANVKIEGLNPLRTFSTHARIDSIGIASAIIQKNPLFGVGFNAYRYAMNRYGYRVNPKWEVSHADAGTDNSFLFIFATTGVFGLIAYLALLWSIVKKSIKSAKKNRFGPVVAASIVGLVVDSVFINSLFFPAFMLWVWILVGLMEST